MIVRVSSAINVCVAVIIGVFYSMLILITFLVATQAIADIVEWARESIGRST
jgi:hypothetical protein